MLDYPAIQANINQIARQAGKSILRYYAQISDVTITYKDDKSPVTIADQTADTLIREALQEAYPAIPIISEESPIPDYETRKSWESFWLVDPLDGTKEFLKGNDEFTVNIGLIHQGIPVVGTIYAPALGTMYFGNAAEGAFKEQNGTTKRIYSLEWQEHDEIIIVESRSHPSKRLEEHLRTFQIRQRIQRGSSLKFCLVAEGSAHYYPRVGGCTKEWDVAAGDCIFRYSGTAFPTPRKTDLVYNKQDLLSGKFQVGAPIETKAQP